MCSEHQELLLKIQQLEQQRDQLSVQLMQAQATAHHQKFEIQRMQAAIDGLTLAIKMARTLVQAMPGWSHHGQELAELLSQALTGATKS